MAWQKTARGGRYYYQSVRLPGRPNPVKLYLGTGEAARRAAALVAARREGLAQAKRAAADLAARFAEADRLAVELAGWGVALFAAAMTRAGYRKHHGSWRRGRATAMPKAKAKAKAKKVFDKFLPVGEPVDGEDEVLECDLPGWKPDLHFARETVKSIARKVREGNASAAARLPGWLEAFPELLDEVAGLAERAEAAWLAAVTAGDPYEAAGLKRGAAARRAELRGPAPPPLASVLVEEVILAELAARHADVALAGERAGSSLIDVWVKRAESAQRRLRAAVTALARVRATEQPAAPVPAAAPGRGGAARPPDAPRRRPPSGRRAKR